MNFCWRWFTRGLAVLILAALAGAVYYFFHRDDEIRRRIEEKLASHYPRLRVQVRSAQFIPGEGIIARGISILEPSAAGPQAELIFVDEMILSCSATWRDLLQGEPAIDRIIVRRPRVRATRRENGQWSTAKLFPLPRFSDRPPPGQVEEGLVEIFDPLRQPAAMLNFHGLHVKFQPTADKATASSGVPGDAPVAIEGSASGDHFSRAEFSGQIDLARGKWAIQGSLERLEWGPDLCQAVPAPFGDELQRLSHLRAEAGIRFALSGDRDGSPTPRFELSGTIRNGRLDDPRLPLPLSEMQASFHGTNEGFSISDLRARGGEAELHVISYMSQGYGEPTKASLQAEATRLRLGPEMTQFLPPRMQPRWDELRPEGSADAQLKLEFDGGRWRPEATIQFADLSFTVPRYPYRLNAGQGSLRLFGERWELHLVAHAALQPVRIDGAGNGEGGDFAGRLEARGERIPFDEKLLAAMPRQVASVVRSLAPQGTFNLTVRLDRDQPSAPVRHRAWVELNRCSTMYDKFRYPLRDIQGTIEVSDGRWLFRDLVGTNDGGRVRCQGALTPAATGARLTLEFTGENLALDDELRDSLPPQVQAAWRALQPRGAVDLDRLTLAFATGQPRPSIEFWARPVRDLASLEPTAFPYRLDKVRGEVHYRDGVVEWRRISAEHGRTRLAAAGRSELGPLEAWNLKLTNLSIDRLFPDPETDRDLYAALPESLKRGVDELHPTGPLHLRGELSFTKSDPGASLATAWDLEATMLQGGLDCGIKLENVCGGVRLRGTASGGRFSSQGELALDHVTYKDLHWTDVRGPAWVDGERVLLGAPADAMLGGEGKRQLTARLLGGIVRADAQVTRGAARRFSLNATLAGGDLGQFARENLAGSQQLRGKILAQIALQGTGKGMHALSGGGAVHLTEADIYELPLMVALLKILSVRPPDATAFTKSDIEFLVEGEHLRLNKINFNGDAVSLLGKGWMKLDKQVNLTFHAMVGRDELPAPLLNAVLRQASKQIWQIHVDGNLDNPQLRSEPLPAVNQALQQLQADLQFTAPRSPPGPAPAASRGETPRR